MAWNGFVAVLSIYVAWLLVSIGHVIVEARHTPITPTAPSSLDELQETATTEQDVEEASA